MSSNSKYLLTTCTVCRQTGPLNLYYRPPELMIRHLDDARTIFCQIFIKTVLLYLFNGLTHRLTDGQRDVQAERQHKLIRVEDLRGGEGDDTL